MKNGPIFSLAIIDKLEILDDLFAQIYIPTAVWEEITRDKTTSYYQKIADYFQEKVKEISGFNELTFIMDYGESESVILYKELNANYLLIDDKKARDIAEHFGIQCIGTIGILSTAKDKGMIDDSDIMAIHIDESNPDIVLMSACSGIYRSHEIGRAHV